MIALPMLTTRLCLGAPRLDEHPDDMTLLPGPVDTEKLAARIGDAAVQQLLAAGVIVLRVVAA